MLRTFVYVHFMFLFLHASRNSEASITTGLSLSSSFLVYARTKNAKSSSVSEDLSNSKTVKREEYVTPSENEKPRNAEANLQLRIQFLIICLQQTRLKKAHQFLVKS